MSDSALILPSSADASCGNGYGVILYGPDNRPRICKLDDRIFQNQNTASHVMNSGTHLVDLHGNPLNAQAENLQTNATNLVSPQIAAASNAVFHPHINDWQNYSALPLIQLSLSMLPSLSLDYVFPEEHGSRCTPAIRILRANIILGCLGMTHFHDIEMLNNAPLFVRLIGGKPISEETYRQRLNKIAKYKSIYVWADGLIIETLKLMLLFMKKETFFGKSLYVLDLDVSVLENPNAHKEGLDWTYKKVLGYAPMFSYAMHYGVSFELRPGNQHSECGMIEYCDKVFYYLGEAGIKKEEVIVRLDSGNDDSKLRRKFCKEGVFFIGSGNPRREDFTKIVQETKKNGFKKDIYSEENSSEVIKTEYYSSETIIDEDTEYKRCFRVTVNYTDQNGIKYTEEQLNTEEYTTKEHSPQEVSFMYTNLEPETENKEEVVSMYDSGKYSEAIFGYYKPHATMEQYHSEFKSELKYRLLPSGKFATNELILCLGVVSFNIVRWIGDMILGIDDSFQYHKNIETKRLRCGTVLKTFFFKGFRFVSHARRTEIKLSEHYEYRDTYLQVYKQLKMLRGNCSKAANF